MLAMDEQMQTMNIEERRMLVELIEVLEDISLDKFNPEKFTRIGTSMEEKMKHSLIQFLKKSTNVFAWSHEDMLGIDLSVITNLFVRRKECLPQNETMLSKRKFRIW